MRGAMRAVAAGLMLVGSAGWAQGKHAPGTYKVGVAERAFLNGDAAYDWRGAKIHALLTTIWYPAGPEAREVQQWAGNPAKPFAMAGRAAPGAAMAKGPAKFPLILLSHGTGGTAAMMAWLGTRLAAHGFIAAAVNHPGNNALEPYTVQGFTLGWERAVDLSQVLNGMLADREFGPRIDASRVGAAGMSFGGYTLLEAAGGIGDMSALMRECEAGKTPRAGCQPPPEFPGLVKEATELYRTDAAYRKAMDAGGEPHVDGRIRAVFAMAPFAAVFSAESLEKIRIPVEIVVGAGDPILAPKNNAEYAAAHIPGAKLTVYPGGVGHYTFVDSCTALGKKEMPQLCVDAAGVNRHAIHEEAGKAAIKFFDRALGK